MIVHGLTILSQAYSSTFRNTFTGSVFYSTVLAARCTPA